MGKWIAMVVGSLIGAAQTYCFFQGEHWVVIVGELMVWLISKSSEVRRLR